MLVRSNSQSLFTQSSFDNLPFQQVLSRKVQQRFGAGEHHFQLRLRKDQKSSQDLFTWPLLPVTMQPSRHVVAAIEISQQADISAGEQLPNIRSALPSRELLCGQMSSTS